MQISSLHLYESTKATKSSQGRNQLREREKEREREREKEKERESVRYAVRYSDSSSRQAAYQNIAELYYSFRKSDLTPPRD